MWHVIYKKVNKDWNISIIHFVFGEGCKNEYSVFIKHKSNDWLWEDIKYNRNQLHYEVVRLKKSILLNKRLKSRRLCKSR